MEHVMGLYEVPFNSIKSGKKTVEVRLCDEKRRKLKLGETIKFTQLPDCKETITVKVIELRKYPTFKEMYESVPAEDFNAVGSSIDERVDRIHQIYTPKEEKKWGTLAIGIKLC